VSWKRAVMHEERAVVKMMDREEEQIEEHQSSPTSGCLVDLTPPST
jgi:hypothetical protein